jgi:hypothetical protein
MFILFFLQVYRWNPSVSGSGFEPYVAFSGESNCNGIPVDWSVVVVSYPFPFEKSNSFFSFNINRRTAALPPD